MSLSQHVEPHRAPAPLGLVLSIVIASLGGFVGGLLLEHGPTYLNVHITQPVLGQPADVSEFVSVAPAESALLSKPIQAESRTLASGAESRIVVHGDGATFLVLHDAPGKTLGTGPIRSSRLDDADAFLVTLRQDVNSDVLTAEQRAWLDSPATLFDARGYACSATVEAIELMQQYAGDGTSFETWDEYGDGPLLAARLSATKGNCSKAIWGRHASLAPPSIGRISRGTKSERKEARRAFRKSAAYRALQEQFLDEGHTGNWDAFWEGTLSINVIRSPEQELVFVQAQVGGCGDFDAQLGTIFERRDDGTLQALPSDSSFLAGVDAAADVDGDGDLDFMIRGDAFDRSLMLHTDDGLHTRSRSLVGIYYCRC